MKNRKSSLIWGLIFIVAGVLYILNAFTSIKIDIFDFWPLLFILPSIASMFSKGIRISNSLFLLIGISFLLTEFNIISESTMDKLFIPCCLIVIGIIIIFKDKLIKKNIPKWVNEKDSFNKSNYYNAVFSSNKVVYPHDTFEGCEANSIFGSVIIDLRDAIITEDTVINCYCVFAGIDIYVPSNVNIRISGTPIFGGITNKTGDYENINAPTIFINATTMFGGVTIKWDFLKKQLNMLQPL